MSQENLSINNEQKNNLPENQEGILSRIDELQKEMDKMEEDYMKERNELLSKLSEKIRNQIQARTQEIRSKSILHRNTDLRGMRKQDAMLLNDISLAEEFEDKSFGEKKLREKLANLGFEIIESDTTYKLRDEDLHLEAINNKGYTYFFKGKRPLLSKEIKYTLETVVSKNIKMYSREFEQDVESAIEDESYEGWIDKGYMTANDAKIIIETAGIRVPATIRELARKEIEG